MVILKNSGSVTNYITRAKKAGERIGFVPTMGALHSGHIALIEEAKSKCGLVVCSIFVNPTQFNNPKDFQQYPITLEQDILQLMQAGTGLLILPSVDDLYPNGTVNLEQYDLGYLDTVLEGAYRPGHFQGVCQVMSRLLKTVQPNFLYMGQKDYQQCMVVKRLLQILPLPIDFVTCPTVREKDGLAMSSRNKRLNLSQRQKAVGIYYALMHIQGNILSGSLKSLKRKAMALLEQYEFNIDYVEIADAVSLEIVEEWDGKQKLVALIAAYQDEVRLIDNMLILP
jgi:pantoate--beta-alanine ligase